MLSLQTSSGRRFDHFSKLQVAEVSSVRPLFERLMTDKKITLKYFRPFYIYFNFQLANYKSCPREGTAVYGICWYVLLLR